MIVGIIKDNGFTKNVAKKVKDSGVKEIHIAQTQEAAIQLIRQQTFDLLIVDPHLTQNEHLEDGIEVIKEVRHIEEQNTAHACYILLLTATPMPPEDNGLQARARRAGADDCLSTKERGNWLRNLTGKIEDAIDAIRSRSSKPTEMGQ